MTACLVTLLTALAIIPARARSDTTASPGAETLVSPVVPPVDVGGIRRFSEAPVRRLTAGVVVRARW